LSTISLIFGSVGVPRAVSLTPRANELNLSAMQSSDPFMLTNGIGAALYRETISVAGV